MMYEISIHSWNTVPVINEMGVFTFPQPKKIVTDKLGKELKKLVPDSVIWEIPLNFSMLVFPRMDDKIIITKVGV